MQFMAAINKIKNSKEVSKMGHPKGHHHAMGPESCHCGCSPFFRHFVTSKEERERLEEYKEQLKKELQGVEECIQEIKGK